MASIVKQLDFAAPADEVWAGVRAVGTPHLDLAPGFVVDARLDGDDARIVTFVNGAVARELIVDVDEGTRRLAYAVVDSPMGLTHYHATMQIGDDPTTGGSRMTWVVDVLPEAAAQRIDEMMAAGSHAMSRHFARAPR